MKIRLTQETLNRLKRFRKNKRAFWSLIVLVVAYLLSLTSPWTVNDEPLLMRYQGKTYFPAFVRYSDADFGGEYQTEADYAKLFAAVRECEEDAAEGFTRAGGSLPYASLSKITRIYQTSHASAKSRWTHS